MDTKYIISLEIGSSAIKAAAAKIAGDSRDKLSLLAIEEQPITDIVPRGRIQNVEEVTHHTREILDRLAATPEVYPRKIVAVRVGIGGRSLRTQKTAVALRLPSEREITQEIIDRLFKEASAKIPEGREPLEVIPTRYVVDGVVQPRPKGSFGKEISADFTLVYCDAINVKNLRRVIDERLGLNIECLVVRPLAIANLVLSKDDTVPGCMLVDLGAETTTVSIFKNSNLQYISTIPLGSRHITRDLANGLGIIEERAEQTKISLGTAIPDLSRTDPQQARIDSYVQARASEIVANIFAHIDFAGYKPKDLGAGIILTGRGSKLRNFGPLLEQHSGMKVRSAHVPNRILVSDSSINTTDNIDIIAVSSYDVIYDLEHPEVQYVTEPQPAPQPEVKQEEYVIDPDEYEKVDNVPSDGFGFDFDSYQEPGANYREDGDELLDDDLAEQKRQKEEARKRDDERRAQELAEKEREARLDKSKKQESSLKNWLTRLQQRATEFMNSSGDNSDDMDSE